MSTAPEFCTRNLVPYYLRWVCGAEAPTWQIYGESDVSAFGVEIHLMTMVSLASIEPAFGFDFRRAKSMRMDRDLRYFYLESDLPAVWTETTAQAALVEWLGACEFEQNMRAILQREPARQTCQKCEGTGRWSGVVTSQHLCTFCKGRGHL